MNPTSGNAKKPDHLGLPRSEHRRYGFSFGEATGVDSYIGVKGELTIDITNNQIRRHDGTTPGGIVVGNVDLSNIEQRLTSLEEGGVDISAALEPIETRLSTLENQELDLSSVINPIETRILALENQELPNYDSEISAINDTLNQLSNELQNVGGGDTSALEGQIASLEDQLAVLDQKVTEIQDQVNSLPKRLKLVIDDFSADSWTLPEGVTVQKAYGGSSIEIIHNQGVSPVSWSGIDRSSAPAQPLTPTSLVNMQILDDNTVIITSIESTNVFDIVLNF